MTTNNKVERDNVCLFRFIFVRWSRGEEQTKQKEQKKVKEQTKQRRGEERRREGEGKTAKDK